MSQDGPSYASSDPTHHFEHLDRITHGLPSFKPEWKLHFPPIVHLDLEDAFTRIPGHYVPEPFPRRTIQSLVGSEARILHYGSDEHSEDFCVPLEDGMPQGSLIKIESVEEALAQDLSPELPKEVQSPTLLLPDPGLNPELPQSRRPFYNTSSTIDLIFTPAKCDGSGPTCNDPACTDKISRCRICNQSNHASNICPLTRSERTIIREAARGDWNPFADHYWETGEIVKQPPTSHRSIVLPIWDFSKKREGTVTEHHLLHKGSIAAGEFVYMGDFTLRASGMLKNRLLACLSARVQLLDLDFEGLRPRDYEQAHHQIMECWFLVPKLAHPEFQRILHKQLFDKNFISIAVFMALMSAEDIEVLNICDSTLAEAQIPGIETLRAAFQKHGFRNLRKLSLDMTGSFAPDALELLLAPGLEKVTFCSMTDTLNRGLLLNHIKRLQKTGRPNVRRLRFRHADGLSWQVVEAFLTLCGPLEAFRFDANPKRHAWRSLSLIHVLFRSRKTLQKLHLCVELDDAFPVHHFQGLTTLRCSVQAFCKESQIREDFIDSLPPLAKEVELFDLDVSMLRLFSKQGGLLEEILQRKKADRLILRALQLHVDDPGFSVLRSLDQCTRFTKLVRALKKEDLVVDITYHDFGEEKRHRANRGRSQLSPAVRYLGSRASPPLLHHHSMPPCKYCELADYIMDHEDLDIQSIASTMGNTPTASLAEVDPMEASLLESVPMVTPQPRPAIDTSVPWPGNTYILRSQATSHILTLLEGRPQLLPPGNRGCIHWTCVEHAGFLGFRNVASGKYLGFDDKHFFCCFKDGKADSWEKFMVVARPQGGFVMLMTHGSNWTLWPVGMKQGKGKDGEERLAKVDGGWEKGLVWEFVKV